MESIPSQLTLDFSMLSFLIATVSIVTSFLLGYKLFRPYFNARVTCWFCHKQSSVPYGNRNCWDCLECDQYNGFTGDGDYNKAIPSQHDEDLNHAVPCTERTDYDNPSKLCDRCDKNQMLKIKQLANFTPTIESRFDEEVEAYTKKLERIYRLCGPCEARVNDVIHRQNSLLRPKLLRYMPVIRSNQLNNSMEGQTQSGGGILSKLHILLRVSVFVLSLMILMMYMAGVSPRALENPLVYAVHTALTSKLAQLKLTGLITQLITIVTSIKLSRGGLLISFLLSVLWLYSYGHEVFLSHSLLPQVLSGPHIPAVFHTLVLLLALIRSNKPKVIAQHRPVSPASSDLYNSMFSNHSDSGVSGSHMNDDLYTPHNSPPPARQAKPTEDHEAMDCGNLPADISSLNISASQLNGSFSNLNGNNSYRDSPRSRPLIKPAQFDTTSVHSGRSNNRAMYNSAESTCSFRTAAPSMRAGSHYTQPKHQATSQHSYLSGGSSYAPSYARSGYAPSYATARSGYPPSFATARSGYAPSVSPPPYMRGGEYDIPSVSPQQMSPGSAYYSPSTIMSYHTRGAPEGVSLLTQIILGISIGVNISIAAFIMGRYSANGDLLSFV